MARSQWISVIGVVLTAILALSYALTHRESANEGPVPAEAQRSEQDR